MDHTILALAEPQPLKDYRPYTSPSFMDLCFLNMHILLSILKQVFNPTTDSNFNVVRIVPVEGEPEVVCLKYEEFVNKHSNDRNGRWQVCNLLMINP